MTAFVPKTPLADLCRQLDQNTTTSRALVDAALERIDSAGGNGDAAFIEVSADSARAQADAADALRRAGTRLSPLAGLPISIKDLFDVQGQVSRAGSIVLGDALPAVVDAPAVAALRRAGAVLIGRTNMSEFAFSGLGLNPHYGSPASPWRPHGSDDRRVSGGSSSGAAVSVAHGMAAAGLGSDTGGSLRIPAAFCGLTGFKPTASRIPTSGGIPLSTTLDSFGAIAPTVACCAMVDRVLAGMAPVVPLARPLEGLRLAVLTNLVNDDIEGPVAQAYQAVLLRLAAAGVHLHEVHFDALNRLPEINRYGFSAMEAWWYHRGFIAKQAGSYDRRVLARIERGEPATAVDYLDLMQARRQVIAEAEQVFGSFDAVLMPTTPILPPSIAALEQDEAAFFVANGLALRNPSIINFIDGCALSVPLPTTDGAPVGLMIAGLQGRDNTILSVGQAIEAALL